MQFCDFNKTIVRKFMMMKLLMGGCHRRFLPKGGRGGELLLLEFLITGQTCCWIPPISNNSPVLRSTSTTRVCVCVCVCVVSVYVVWCVFCSLSSPLFVFLLCGCAPHIPHTHTYTHTHNPQYWWSDLLKVHLCLKNRRKRKWILSGIRFAMSFGCPNLSKFI